jgi:hypothetical protein
MIPIGSEIVVSVEGVTDPLFGETKLQDKEIRERLERNLVRRGYVIDKTGYKFLVQFKFRTERRDKTTSSSYMSTGSFSGNYNYNASGAASIYGLSAALAQIISAMASSTKTTALNSTQTMKYYTHSVTMEIRDRSGNLVWVGESTWDSPDINFKDDSYLAIQLLIVNLPKKENVYPKLQKLQSDKVENFYNLYCKYFGFASPALPYRTKFNTSGTTYFPKQKIKNSEYLPFYIDLLQTAEDALPTGKKTYKNPLDRQLWSKAMVGSKYTDNNGKIVNVLIYLYGQSYGYTIQNCWIASDEEYADFESRLKIWKKAIHDYYDVYEK